MLTVKEGRGVSLVTFNLSTDCFGEEKGDVCVSQPKYDKLFELQFSLETEFDKATTRYPRLQLYKLGGNIEEEGFGLITFSNNGDKRCLITLN